MKLIERPLWIRNALSDRLDDRISQEAFQKWFDTTLEDHYAVHKDDLVRVTGQNVDDGIDQAEWGHHKYKCGSDTHQAYLIKSSIEPLKQETCADVLRRLIIVAEENRSLLPTGQWVEQAKAALSRARDNEERES